MAFEVEGRRVECRTRDLSLGGMFLDTTAVSLPFGTELTVTLPPLPDGTLRIEVRPVDVTTSRYDALAPVQILALRMCAGRAARARPWTKRATKLP